MPLLSIEHTPRGYTADFVFYSGTALTLGVLFGYLGYTITFNSPAVLA
ncbi:MAG: hypothetical protein ACTJG9_00970 [Alcaligenes aquatilis]